ncbi:hypothetical protein ACFO3O_03750 [Dokdonia ponticola]|uniref:Bacteriocin n=1 Tax=Dokdonia ponticola TaxID=2041041 RepID=A0ABV9HUP1_9FLAO
MKKLKSILGATVLNNKQQKNIQAGAGGLGGNVDLSLCGCDCAGRVTGPFYCSFYIACPQVYTC